MHDDTRPLDPGPAPDGARSSIRLSRRQALLASLGAAAGAAGAATGLAGGATGPSASAAATCILSPEVTEGPYWIDSRLTRRDITGGKAGLPLEIAFTVEDARTCKPISGADVEIWHCDARGLYSGFERASQGGGGPGAGSGPTDSKRYLRGHQKADAAGVALFRTVFPGWYRGRTPHIHLKVHVGGNVVHTGQVFFNEATTARVYRQAPYKSHGRPDTSHAADNIYAQAGSSKAVLRLAGRGAGKKGYRGTITLGVAT
jgi:protocatechuate 3,4-dioxygenase beta subunit